MPPRARPRPQVRVGAIARAWFTPRMEGRRQGAEVFAELIAAQLPDAVRVGVSGERVTGGGGEPDRDDVIEQAVAGIAGYHEPWPEAVAEVAAIDLASLRAARTASPGLPGPCQARPPRRARPLQRAPGPTILRAGTWTRSTQRACFPATGWLARDLAAGHDDHVGAAAGSVAGADYLEGQGVKDGEVAGGEGDVQGGDVLLKPLDPLGARDRG